MRCITTVCMVVLAIFLSAGESTADKLVELIPSLYGGNGISLATDPLANHTAHFSINAAASINQLNEQIAAEIGAFPFSSSVGGFTFTFDPSIGNFVSSTESLGPLFAERAPTLGRGNLNLNVSFTAFKYDTFSGENLDHLTVIARHDTDIIGFPDVREQFEHDIVLINVDLDIKVRILAFAATYGVTDRLDLGILVPVVHVDMDVEAAAEVVQAPQNTLFPGVHTFVGGPESPRDSASGDATGLGDIVLRAKYHVYKSDMVDLATALLVKLDTADEDNFLGTGDTTVRPFVVVSRTYTDVLRPGLSVTPHVNLGIEFNTDHNDQNAVEYVVGFDAGTKKLVGAVELIGSHEIAGDGIGDDILNAAVGVKWNPLKRFILAGNVQFPLNDNGLRSYVIPTLSVEYSF